MVKSFLEFVNEALMLRTKDQREKVVLGLIKHFGMRPVKNYTFYSSHPDDASGSVALSVRLFTARDGKPIGFIFMEGDPHRNIDLLVHSKNPSLKTMPTSFTFGDSARDLQADLRYVREEDLFSFIYGLSDDGLHFNRRREFYDPEEPYQARKGDTLRGFLNSMLKDELSKYVVLNYVIASQTTARKKDSFDLASIKNLGVAKKLVAWGFDFSVEDMPGENEDRLLVTLSKHQGRWQSDAVKNRVFRLPFILQYKIYHDGRIQRVNGENGQVIPIYGVLRSETDNETFISLKHIRSCLDEILFRFEEDVPHINRLGVTIEPNKTPETYNHNRIDGETSDAINNIW